MISAQDFMMVCGGLAMVFVGLSFSIKILSGIRAKSLIKQDVLRSTMARIEEPDPMEQRLQELRGSRFGRPLVRPSGSLTSQPTPQTSGFRAIPKFTKER